MPGVLEAFDVIEHVRPGARVQYILRAVRPVLSEEQKIRRILVANSPSLRLRWLRGRTTHAEMPLRLQVSIMLYSRGAFAVSVGADEGPFCGRESLCRAKLRSQPHSPTARTRQTRRTTLRILQQDQSLTRRVLNPAVISLGENGPGREPFSPIGAWAGQQVWREKPADVGLSSPRRGGRDCSVR